MNWGSWLLWGFVATLVLTTMMSASQGLGLTRMSLPTLLGTVISPDRDRARIIGFFFHLVNGWIFSLFYVLVFTGIGRATWWLGLLGGLLHGAFVLTAGMALLPGLHPRIASEQHGPSVTRQLEPPGFLALHYGARTPIVTLLAHLAFGVILGVLYAVK